MYASRSLTRSLIIPLLVVLLALRLAPYLPVNPMNHLLNPLRSIARSRITNLSRNMTSSFVLPSTSTQVHLTHDLTQEQLLSFHPFKSWLYTLQRSLSLQSAKASHPFHNDPYRLESITIQSVDFFGARVGFIKLKTVVKSKNGDTLPGSVFLRGGSVAILLILETEGQGALDKRPERWAVLTVQPRIPAGSLEMVELPAGMIDDSGTFSGAAAKEIEEECGIKIPADKLIDLTSLALGGLSNADNECLEEAVYPSPGGSDEFMKIYAYVHKVKEETLKDWQGKLTGLREHGEKITLKVVRLENLWRETRDVKALSALALWAGLKM